jgi:hypothetical protein
MLSEKFKCGNFKAALDVVIGPQADVTMLHKRWIDRGSGGLIEGRGE